MTSTTPAASHHDRRWVLMAFVAIAQLMVVLDATIVNIALPSAQADLGFADSDRQWIITAYSLAFGSLLLLGGRLADLFGRKQTFIAGLIGFAAASVLGGAAGSFGMLVVSRVLQGAFGAILAPAALSTLVTTFTSPRDRGKAFGIFGTVAVSGGAVGLILGGILTEYVSWRWCLYVNVVFAVVAVIGVATFMPRERSPERPHIDVLGALLASSGLFALVFGFSRAEAHGWGAPSAVASLVTGVVLLLAFIAWQRRAPYPLLPLRIPANRTRGAAYISVGLAMAGAFGLFLFLTYYLQTVKGFSPVICGVAFLPMVGCIVVMSNASSLYLLPKFGPRRIIPIGMTFGAIGMLNLTRIDPSSSYAGVVLPSLILIGVGMGSVIAPSMNTATVGVEPADAGVASALVNTMQQVGGSIGTAVLSTVVAAATADYLGSHPADPLAAATHGYSTAFAVAAAVYAVGAIVAVTLLPAGKPASAEVVGPTGDRDSEHRLATALATEGVLAEGEFT